MLFLLRECVLYESVVDVAVVVVNLVNILWLLVRNRILYRDTVHDWTLDRFETLINPVNTHKRERE